MNRLSKAHAAMITSAITTAEEPLELVRVEPLLKGTVYEPGARHRELTLSEGDREAPRSAHRDRAVVYPPF